MPKHVWTPAQQVSREELFNLGHFHPSFDGKASWDDVAKLDPKSKEFRKSTGSYQEIAGLYQDEDFGDRTVDSLRFRRDAQGYERICDCADIEALTEESNISNGTQTWPNPEKPIVFGRNFQSVPGLSAGDTSRAWKEALADWNKSCGVNLVEGDSDDAHVKIWLEGLSGGTLAIALLSLGHRRINGHWQKYDKSGRTWSLNMLRGVIIHESGHTMGYSHSSSGTSIMRPFMNPNITVIQAADRKRFQRDYGPPLNTPDLPDPPVPPGEGDLVNGTLQLGDKFVTIKDGRADWIGR